MRQAYDARCSNEERTMRQPYQYPHPGGPRRAQRLQQLRLECDVHQLVGHQCAAQHLQAPAARGRLQDAIVDVADQLGGNEYAHVELEPGEPAQAAEGLIGPVTALERNAVILHERAQQRSVALLLADEKLDDAYQRRHLPRPREALGSAPQRAALGLLAELEGRNRAGNELPLFGFEDIGELVRNAARVLGVVLEVIQPDLQVIR